MSRYSVLKIYFNWNDTKGFLSDVIEIENVINDDVNLLHEWSDQ